MDNFVECVNPLNFVVVVYHKLNTGPYFIVQGAGSTHIEIKRFRILVR